MKILILQNDSEAPSGFFGSWIDARGHDGDVVCHETAALLPDAREYGAIVSLGSDESVHASRKPWVREHVDYLRRARDARVPILGICFGAQALAAAIGGAVYALPQTEMFWGSPSHQELAFGGPWLTWHRDSFTLPPDADVLARSPECIQAYRQGPNVGVQFHPEVTPDALATWVDGRNAVDLAINGVDRPALIAEFRERADEIERRSHALFDEVASRWD